MSKVSLAIHAHFYQPSRSLALMGRIGSESSAAPYRNWYERANKDVYRPNMRLGNFSRFSFDFSGTILDWMTANDVPTHQKIVKSGSMLENVLAAPFFQSPLPHLSPRDQLIQLLWGRQDAIKRFGYAPKGVYLPMFAADHTTLQAVVDAGFEYTLLRASQVDDVPRRGGSGPYQIHLPSGDTIRVFVVNDTLSASMLNEMAERSGAGYWSHQELIPHYRQCGDLTLLFVDGDMLGQHKLGEPYFVHYLMRTEARAAGFQPITVSDYYAANPDPIADIELRPYQTPPLTASQTILSEALQNLLGEVDDLATRHYDGNQWWMLQKDYFAQFPKPSSPLLEGQLYLQRAWANCMDLPHYPQLGVMHVIDDAAHALTILDDKLDVNLTDHFQKDLSPHISTLFHHSLSTHQTENTWQSTASAAAGD